MTIAHHNESKNSSAWENQTELSPEETIELLEQQIDTLENQLIVLEQSNKKLIQQQKLLLRNEYKFKEAQRIASIGSWEIDFLTNRLLCSEETAHLLEVPLEQLKQYEDFLAFICPEERPLFEQTYHRSVNEHQTYEQEHRLQLPQGKIKFVKIFSKTLYTPEGIALRSVGLIQDISETKHAHAKLVHMERLASLGEMATGVAHEINQPLQVIMMNIGLGIESVRMNKSEKALDLLKKSLTQIDHITQIVSHLRNFSRQGNDHSMALCQLNQIAQNALIFFQYKFRLKNIELEVRLQPDLPEVCGQAVQIEQVLVNLLNNAEDAVDEQAFKKITLRTFVQQEQIILEIHDTGIGIAAETLPKIFDPFFTTKTFGKGTGVGLSISQTIIQNHRGSLEVQSQVGVGTTFRMSLPPASPFEMESRGIFC